jgi:alkanesulfonate monooxygenase SsuD/methylene tetrahydromethanopterin reductase-like flavin-dependent oxidoreductase (luciferase family)
MVMPQRKALFGIGGGTAVSAATETLRLAVQADHEGLDLFTVSDHPYYGGRLDAYSIVAVALGRTANIAGLVSVTNLPSRPAPMLARTITSLSALSGGRIVLGIGAGGLWDEIAKLGVPRREPGAAVRALEEAITLIRALSGGGAPVTFDGEFYQVSALEPAPVPAAPVWTGSVGPKSLAVTGRVADGWIPGHASDWLSPRYRESRPIIDSAAAAAGRDPGDIATIYNLPGRITPAPLAYTRDGDGRWIGGSVEQWVDELTGAVLEHDASGFVYFAADDIPADVTLGRWAQEIVPAVREAVAARLGNLVILRLAACRENFVSVR